MTSRPLSKQRREQSLKVVEIVAAVSINEANDLSSLAQCTDRLEAGCTIAALGFAHDGSTSRSGNARRLIGAAVIADHDL